MLSVVQLLPESTHDAACVARLSQLLVAGWLSHSLAGNVAWPWASYSAAEELLGFSSLLPEAIVPLQPMPGSHQQLCATMMWHQRPSGSGQPHGCGCQGCWGACGQAEQALVPASDAPTAFGCFVLVLIFQPFVGIFCSQGQPNVEPGEEHRESPLPTSLLT